MQSALRSLLLPALLVLALAASTAGGAAAPQPAPLDQGADVRELAERLLTYPGPGGPSQRVGLLPGQVPSSLPLALPVPPSARIVGSAVRSAESRPMSTDIVIDVPEGARAVMAFYERELPKIGWDQPAGASGRPPGGFQPPQLSYSGAYCQGASGPWLSVSAWGRAGAPTDLRLHLEATHPGPCSAPRGPNYPPANVDPLPPLIAPDGLDLIVNWGGGGPGRWSSEALAETDRGAAELEAHFAGQLRAAGWTRLAGAVDPVLSWSSWKVAGQGDLSGLLYVLVTPASKHRSLRLAVESPSNQSPGGPGMPMPARPAYPFPVSEPPVVIVAPPTPTPAPR